MFNSPVAKRSSSVKTTPQKKEAKKSDKKGSKSVFTKVNNKKPVTKESSPSESSGTASKENKLSSKEVYVQTAYHKKVNYLVKGEAKDLSDVEVTVVEFIESNYLIPHDFEIEKTQYGGLANLCYERRLIQCYNSKRLLLGAGKDSRIMCYKCACFGHKFRYCPKAFS